MSNFCLVVPTLDVSSAKMFLFSRTTYSIFFSEMQLSMLEGLVGRFGMFFGNESVNGLSEPSILFELRLIRSFINFLMPLIGTRKCKLHT